MALKKKELKEFKKILLDERNQLINNASDTLKNEIELSKDDMSDEADLASALIDQGLSLRLRGRERTLIEKIDSALERIETGEFGVCVTCEDDISNKRLHARPVTTMCIACKEEQEKQERHYQG